MKIVRILMVLTSVAFSAEQKAVDPRPNILFIRSDDHAAHAIGAYGSRLSPLNFTPVIDRLAAEAIVFERAYCKNFIFTPSRASILTGQCPQTNGALGLTGKLPPAKQYLPDEMKKTRYQGHRGQVAPLGGEERVYSEFDAIRLGGCEPSK